MVYFQLIGAFSPRDALLVTEMLRFVIDHFGEQTYLADLINLRRP